MTRVLSELMEADTPLFQRSIQHLERMGGHPNADIRLSTEVLQSTRNIIRELGLDAADTTGPELYAALGSRLHADEKRFQALIGVEAGATVQSLLVRTLRPYIIKRNGYGLKAAAIRRVLKANLPKKTMKALGYRSAESMFKHESPA